jgi:hypothetical protein
MTGPRAGHLLGGSGTTSKVEKAQPGRSGALRGGSTCRAAGTYTSVRSAAVRA